MLTDLGHTVKFVCREREYVVELLTHYGFDYEISGIHSKGILQKILGGVKNCIAIFRILKKDKPTIIVSHSSIYAGIASFFSRTPHLAIEDTYNQEQLFFSIPFSDVVLTGDYPHRMLGKKEVRYPGYHELAYLHPAHFHPKVSVLEKIGVKKNEKFAVLRFIAWNATHDLGHQGITLENKYRLVEEIGKKVKVFISSELELPNRLKKFQLKIRAEEMHHVLFYASLYVGESATMAAESACLGTPAVYLDNTGRGYTDDLQNVYHLVFNYSESLEDQDRAIHQAVSLLESNGSKEVAMKNRDIMLRDKIDVSSFLVWFIENFPKSIEEMKKREFSFMRFFTSSW
jgi:predicted glycosyltransferase